MCQFAYNFELSGFGSSGESDRVRDYLAPVLNVIYIVSIAYVFLFSQEIVFASFTFQPTAGFIIWGIEGKLIKARCYAQYSEK